MPRQDSRFLLVRIALGSFVLAAARIMGADGNAIDFARDIQPLLAAKCYDCHGAEKPKGGLRLTNRANALRGGESGGPAFLAGRSNDSELIRRVTTDDENDVMPQKGDRLTPRKSSD
jgi:hypothetical protein